MTDAAKIDLIDLALKNTANMDKDPVEFPDYYVATMQAQLAQAVELRRIANALEALVKAVKHDGCN